MAIAKIVLNGVTQMDLTGDTVEADKILSSYTAHKKDGTQITGTYSGGGGNDFVITFEKDQDDVWSPIQTVAEIHAAYQAGKTLVGYVEPENFASVYYVQYYYDVEYGSYLEYAICEEVWTPSHAFLLPAYYIEDEEVYDDGKGIYFDTSNADAMPADVISGKIFYNANGLAVGTASGGGGIGTLLATSATGSVNTTSTQAANLNKDVSVSGIDAYDLLIVEASVDSVTNGRHCATISLIFLTAGTTIGTKNGGTVASNKMNIKVSSNGTYTSVQGTTAYGIYANSVSISNGTATIPMYRRYNSTSTGTINGTYTTRVYGVKLYDLIGG